MNSSPKILVFKLRSLIYTLLLLFFGILLIVCLVQMCIRDSCILRTLLSEGWTDRRACDPA